MSVPRCIFEAHAGTGECPIWDPTSLRLFWLDCTAPSVNRLDPLTGVNESWAAPERIGSIALRRQGGLVAALASGFFAFDPDTGVWSPLAAPAAQPGTNYFNDGRVDIAGRFWAGTMTGPSRSDSGGLYRLEQAGTCTRLFGGIVLSNALCWSPDGKTMYHGDSWQRKVWAYDFDRVTGAVANKRPFIETDDRLGRPDGAVCDADGFVWLALWDGEAILRIDPAGRIERRVPLPVSRVTCPGFGGPDLKTLYITTASFGLDAEARARQPLAGAIFALDVDTPGAGEVMADYPV